MNPSEESGAPVDRPVLGIRPECARVREALSDGLGEGGAASLPDWVRSHLVSCEPCRAEESLLRALASSRPAVPGGLEGRILETVGRVRLSQRNPWWGFAAAAIAAVALGIGVGSEPVPGSGGGGGAALVAADPGEVWPGGDGIVAGAPLLDALSDEALLALLEGF